MHAQLSRDEPLAGLLLLDVVDLGADGRPVANWRFLDETLAVAARYGWSFRVAAWSVVASRARRAQTREAIDVDAIAGALSRFLPQGMR